MYIDVINEKNAGDELKEIYGLLSQQRGKVSNIMRAHSLRPKSMLTHLNLYMDLLFGPGEIKRAEREMIALVVSIINKCSYCIEHHAEALNQYWKDEEKLSSFIGDFRSMPRGSREHAIVTYVDKLTERPWDISVKDVDLVREAGFTDSGILHINLICSYFNYVNRIALGLGVSFDDNEMKGYKY